MNINRIEQMTAEANAFLDRNEADKARELFTSICTEDDSNAEAWLMLGAINGEEGKIDEATSCVRKAIEIDPGYAEAHFTLAKILRSQGDLNGALAAARSAMESDPTYSEALTFLAALQGQMGNLRDAEDAGRRAVAVSLDSPDAYVNLGNVLHMQGKLHDAEDNFRQALQVSPDLASALSGLGGVLVARQQFEEAASSLHRAIELQPDLVEAHNNLGTLYLAQRDFDNALNSLNRVIALAPGFAPGYANKGHIHLQKDEYEQAITHYRKAVDLAPQMIEAHIALGYACRLAGDRDAARASYQTAIGLKPGYLAAHFNLGILEEESGNFERALDCYDEVMRIDPGNIDAQAAQASVYEKTGHADIAHGIIRPLIDSGARNVRLGIAYSRACRHQDNCDAAVHYLESLAETKELSSNEHADIHFSLGQLLDRAELYDSAFAHFCRANDLTAFDYDPHQYEQYIDGVIAANSPDVLASLPSPAVSSNRPVFIVGMPRSGSTLVEQIIAAHPRAADGGELGTIFRIADKLQSVTGSGKIYPSCIADMGQATADAIAREYLAALGQVDPDSERVTDKMPHNFQHLGLIHALFPDAAVIHATRNPLDTCLSVYFHHFAGYHPYSFSMENIASHYLQYERLMRFWKDDAKLPVLDVSYENLVGDPESVSKMIISHCGLEWDDNCLNFHATGRSAKTASYAQVRQPVYSSAIGRWRHYRPHIGPLLECFPEAQES